MGVASVSERSPRALPWGMRLTRILGVAFIALGLWIAFAPGSVPGLHPPWEQMGPSMGMTP